MEQVPLGNTGLTVSTTALGCGGASRLGLNTGHGHDHAVGIVRAAIDAGVTLIDTATVYGTEEVVGEALRGRRDEVVVSTKIHPLVNGKPLDPPGLVGALEASLKRLRTDWVDIFFMHGVRDTEYAIVLDLVPTLQKLRDDGKIRCFGLTERFIEDPTHVTLQRALKDDVWQVMMIGFSLLNPSARRKLLPETQAQGIGTLCMFAVRRALSNPEALSELLSGLIAEGQLEPGDVDVNDALGFLVSEGHAGSIVEAAYRFCRHEPGIDTVLTGTGNPDHLRQNLAALDAPALSPAALERLEALFGHIDSVSGD